MLERRVLAPTPGTFYSRDALNPDVVRDRHGFRLYFSGNAAATATGDWRTGLAVGKRPAGPFRVRRDTQFEFFNGGTVRRRGFYWHAATAITGGGVLYRSRNGRSWRRVAYIPTGPSAAWDALRSDFYLVSSRGGLDIYYAGRPGASGADLGLLRYRHGRFDDGRMVLGRAGGWDGLDLGEPAVFRARGRQLMLYGGLGGHGEPRRIGLAYRTDSVWKRCPRPLIDVSSRYPGNAIDPEPLMHDGHLYIYFGGGHAPSLGGDMQGTIWLRSYRLP